MDHHHRAFVGLVVRVGFTGTRDGMTNAQQTAVSLLLLELGATILHHGDCIGADDQADQIGRELGLTVYLHPPIEPNRRAWCNTRPGDTWTEVHAEPYLKRNHTIVDATVALIAAPKEAEETIRSGTWATIRYARKRLKPVRVVWPNGSVTTNGGATP